MKVLISGAGVAGLAAALWLGRAGHRVVIVERAASVRAGGFLVSLSNHAYRLADELQLMPALRARQAGITRSSYHDEDGRRLLELDYGPLFGSLDVLQLMRDELVAVLATPAAEVAELRFNDEVSGLVQDSNGVDVAFAEGGEERFDVVIGADGPGSAVRALAFPESAVDYDYLSLHCAAFRAPNVLAMRERFATHMACDRYMAVFNTGANDLGAVFVWDDPARVLSDAPRPDVLRRAFADAGGATAAVLEHAPDRFYMDVLAQIRMAQWTTGRVALVGDAAHCLTLFSGRGAAAAFAGASRLAQALVANPTDHAAAFADYEGQMRPVISQIQPQTRRSVPFYVPRNRALHGLRAQAMRLLPNALFRQYFRWKYARV